MSKQVKHVNSGPEIFMESIILSLTLLFFVKLTSSFIQYTIVLQCIVRTCTCMYIHYNAGAGYKEVTLKNHTNNGLVILHGNLSS